MDAALSGVCPFYSKSTSSVVTSGDFIEHISRQLQSVISVSIIWMFCKTIVRDDDDEKEEVAEIMAQGFLKEFYAAQTMKTLNQKLSYSLFFRGPRNPQEYRTHLKFQRVARDFIQDITKSKVLFPKVNRTKNVSDSTTISYQVYVRGGYVRTVDLETFYHETGIKIGGICEMRSAWKFNDLKPRLYYCIGGTSYWLSSYIKAIAVALMNAIPTTKTETKTHPEKELHSDDGEYMVTWDYSSFTTTLQELKHFLWYIARIAERDRASVEVFDYRIGFTRLALWDLLDQYNEAVNIFAPYSIHRVHESILQFMDDFSILEFTQTNSGMLGVPGNIGFSTALHGLILHQHTEYRKAVCVGDDGFASVAEEPTIGIVPVIQSLNTINTDRFEIVPPFSVDPTIRFLKRKFSRLSGSYSISLLLSLPPMPYIDGKVGLRTKPGKFTVGDRLYKIATQVGSALWDIHSHLSTISDEELSVFNTYLRAVYSSLGLPYRGGLIGSLLPDVSGYDQPLTFCIPPIRFPLDYDPRDTDWLEYLFESTSLDVFPLPRLVLDCFPDLSYADVGDRIQCPQHLLISALEDMDYVSTEPISDLVLVSEVANQRAYSQFIKSGGVPGWSRALHVTIRDEIPFAFIRNNRRSNIWSEVLAQDV